MYYKQSTWWKLETNVQRYILDQPNGVVFNYISVVLYLIVSITNIVQYTIFIKF